MLAPLLSLALLASAAGARVSLRFGGPAEEAKDDQCPLEPADDGALAWRDYGPGGKCCNDDSRLFNCDMVRIGKGSQVKWAHFDEDIPKDSVGEVVKMLLPDVLIKFPQGRFRLDFTELIPVDGEPKEERWYCSCGECLEVEKRVNLANYKVVRSGQHLRSWADFDTAHQVTSYSYIVQSVGLVLFLYPAEDINHAFAYREMLCHRISCWHKNGYAVTMRVVQSVAQAMNVLDSFYDRSLHHVIIGGHGTATSIAWAKGVANRLTTTDPVTNQFLVKLRAKLMLEATVTLDSCKSAGTVVKGSNIWKAIAQALPGRQVKGATVDLKEHMWTAGDDAECVSGDTAVFKEHGVTKMRVRLSGKPHCLEVGQLDVEAAVAEGKTCLSPCFTSCKSTMSTLVAHKVLQQGLFGLVSSGLPSEKDDCGMMQSRNVCKFTFSTGKK